MFHHEVFSNNFFVFPLKVSKITFKKVKGLLLLFLDGGLGVVFGNIHLSRCAKQSTDAFASFYQMPFRLHSTKPRLNDILLIILVAA